MTADRNAIESRRRFLKLVGGSAVLAPLAGLTACSGGNDAAPPVPEPEVESPPAPAASAPAPEPAESAAPQSDAGGMARLSEDDPQAKALAYVHDATTVDSARQPRYEAGQACSNCALYTGDSDAEWGGCGIFPGRQVKATGWCSAYAPKAG